jgi:hypothetical protein
VLFVGDDWAEDHHDVEVQDKAGRRLDPERVIANAQSCVRAPNDLQLHYLSNGLSTRGDDCLLLLSTAQSVWQVWLAGIRFNAVRLGLGGRAWSRRAWSGQDAQLLRKLSM